MSTQPLLQSNPTAAKTYVQHDVSPLQRYNIFIDCYNNPTNIIDNIQLLKVIDSNLYNRCFQLITLTRGKIVFLLLNLIPVIDVGMMGLCLYFLVTYMLSLKIHQQNQELISDPFKKMTFDPQMCYTMNCDYYFFNIQLKELDGFSLNYQQKMSHQLTLRKERGKTRLMIYNANFWAHYNEFTSWKTTHFLPFAVSFCLTIICNTLFFFFILR